MELKKGYKVTVLGMIPEDWSIKEFAEVMDGFSSGQTPYRAVAEYYKGDIPWITSGELNYNIIKDTIEKITLEGAREANLKMIPKGTFLFAITGLEAAGTRGSCAITGIEATTNQSCMALYPKKGLLTTQYLYHYYVRYGNELAFKYCQGTKQQSYTGGIAKKLPIIVPPTIDEQTAIATVLSDMDALISSLEQLIEKKRNIKQGAMQQLLKPKKSWLIKKLGDFVTITSGESPSKFSFKSNGIPYFKVDQLNNSEKYQIETPYFIETENVVKKGSIIFPKRGASILLNKVRILKEDSYMDTNLMTLTLSDALDSEFIYYVMTHIELWKIADTTSIPQINNKHINSIEIATPDLEEQKQIATTLSDMDYEISALEKKLSKCKMLKQGMMQNLLTGKIRLVKDGMQTQI
jgi:type I restriction enzyme, S subunit